MKKIVCLLVLISFYLGCGDIRIPKEDDLKKYPWINNFAPGRIDFKGIEHNLDTGTFSFSFKSSYSLYDFFKSVDEYAAINKWLITDKSLYSRTYKKKSNAYPADEGFENVLLTFNPRNKVIIFYNHRSEK
jgi:hypothetical protein